MFSCFNTLNIKDRFFIMKIQSADRHVNFKGIVYPVKYREQLKTAVTQILPDTFIQLNPKYSECSQKGIFAKIKKMLGISQPKFIEVKDSTNYSSYSNIWAAQGEKREDTLFIREIYKEVPSRVSRPAHEEEIAVFEKMKQDILANAKETNMSDDDFFEKFSVKYFKNVSGDRRADLEDAFNQRLRH